jgi:hypothetical protein
MRAVKRLKKEDEKKGLMNLKLMSQYNINNTLTDKYMPLSDNCHGPYGMMPPELLHTSGSGLIKYMSESLLRAQLGSKNGRDNIDKLHVRLYMTIKIRVNETFLGVP